MPAGNPLYRTTGNTQIGRLANRVDAIERRPGVPGFYEIKIFADDQTVSTGNGKFIFAIPGDLDGTHLRYVNAFITTVSSSGVVQVMIRNVTEAFDMLVSPITIDQGDLDAEDSASPPEIDIGFTLYPWPDPDNTVFYRAQIAIDVDQDGTGAKGLGVMLGFS